MRIFSSFFILISLVFIAVNCATPPLKTLGPSQGSTEPAPAKFPVEGKEEVVLNEWQENRNKSYFDWPVDDARMSRGFLPNRRKPHLGVDLAAPKNTNIYASHEGVVIYTGRDFRGFGRMIMIEGSQGWATLYAHLSSILVKEGQTVTQGQPIGLMGRTGHATGIHLHFEIRKTKGPVDPLLYLPGGSRLAREH
jgi:murein DD-endopeptidase MepM/ murein hydrolase activator NlpD